MKKNKPLRTQSNDEMQRVLFSLIFIFKLILIMIFRGIKYIIWIFKMISVLSVCVEWMFSIYFFVHILILDFLEICSIFFSFQRNFTILERWQYHAWHTI